MGKKSFRQRAKVEKTTLSLDMRKNLVKELLEMLAKKTLTVGNVPELAQLLPRLSSYITDGERVTLDVDLFSCGAVLDLTLPKYISDNPSVSLTPMENTTQSHKSPMTRDVEPSHTVLPADTI